MSIFKELNDISTCGDLHTFAEKYLPLWIEERNPFVAHALGLLVERHRPELDADLFRAVDCELTPEFFYRLALERYKKLAATGSSEAARAVAIFYQLGIHPAERDEKQFLEWLQRAADLGDKQAPLEIALHRKEGKDVT